jgi:hypothetical protein
MTADKLHQLLDGYEFLHTKAGRVHRDLEDQHVGLSSVV